VESAAISAGVEIMDNRARTAIDLDKDIFRASIILVNVIIDTSDYINLDGNQVATNRRYLAGGGNAGQKCPISPLKRSHTF